MANIAMRVWVDNAHVEDACQTSQVFQNDAQRIQGFASGNPASSMRVNTALRQANVVAVGLVQALAQHNSVLEGYTHETDVDTMATAIGEALAQYVSSETGSSFEDLNNKVDRIDSGELGASTNIGEDGVPVYVKNGQITAVPVVDKAANVTTNINGHAIVTIFESDGTTVKNATKAAQDGSGNNIVNTYATKVALSSEASAREAADEVLQQNINSEATARTQAISALQTGLTSGTITVAKASHADTATKATTADTVTNATNVIPDGNGAVNPLGRKADSDVGASSVALGKDSTASADSSIALGRESTASGGLSIAIGATVNASGTKSIALGYDAETVGESSAAVGAGAYAGGHSIAVGEAANASVYSIAVGSNAIANNLNSMALGNNATTNASIGSVALGYGAIASNTDSATIQLGSSSLSVLRCAKQLSVVSDKRDKTDIEGMTDALAFLERLTPVTFVSNNREEYISDEDKKSETFRKYGMCEYDRASHAAGTKKGERRRCGLLAQEVVEAMQSVYGTDNYADIVNDNFHDLTEKPSDVENKYTLAYSNLVPFLIGAIKELNAKLQTLSGAKAD